MGTNNDALIVGDPDTHIVKVYFKSKATRDWNVNPAITIVEADSSDRRSTADNVRMAIEPMGESEDFIGGVAKKVFFVLDKTFDRKN